MKDFVGKLIFGPSISHNSPAVRKVAVETLSVLLLQRKGAVNVCLSFEIASSLLLITIGAGKISCNFILGSNCKQITR